MKIKMLAVVLFVISSCLVGIGSAHARSLLHPFRKDVSQGSASDQMIAATDRKGKFTRTFRAVKRKLIPTCYSAEAGLSDRFRGCVRNRLSATGIDMDKPSNVLAMDSSGKKPITKTYSRYVFNQNWYRRQLFLHQLSEQIVESLNKIDGYIKSLQSQIAQTNADKEVGAAEEKRKYQLDGEEARLALSNKRADSYHNQLVDAWYQYGLLQKEMGRTPDYSDRTVPPPFREVPMPDPINDPIFSKFTSVTGSLLNSKVVEALKQFEQNNPGVIDQMCKQRYADGWEANYVRMADTGPVIQADVQKYQKTKNAMMAIKCTALDMEGLWERAIFSLCPFGQTGEVIPACSGFSSNEIADTQYTGGAQG